MCAHCHHHSTPETMNDPINSMLCINTIIEMIATGWCPGGAQMVPQWCPGGAQAMPRRCPTGAQVAPRWCTGGAQVVFIATILTPLSLSVIQVVISFVCQWYYSHHCHGVVPRWCQGGAQVVPKRGPGGVQVVLRWRPGGAQVVPTRCPDVPIATIHP